MAAIGEPDETLMARTADGDRACLELLVRRHATPLLSFSDAPVRGPAPRRGVVSGKYSSRCG